MSLRNRHLMLSPTWVLSRTHSVPRTSAMTTMTELRPRPKELMPTTLARISLSAQAGMSALDAVVAT